MATKLAPGEISDLDPCKFMAVIGKQVIQPGTPVTVMEISGATAIVLAES